MRKGTYSILEISMLLQVPNTAIDDGTHSTEGFRTTTHETAV